MNLKKRSFLYKDLIKIMIKLNLAKLIMVMYKGGVESEYFQIICYSQDISDSNSETNFDIFVPW